MSVYKLNKIKNPTEYWNGKDQLPTDITVSAYNPVMAEFELLSIICLVHGYITAFDILTGANSKTQKDKDITAVMTAFQMYLYPKLPLSNYSESDRRLTDENLSIEPIDPENIFKYST